MNKSEIKRILVITLSNVGDIILTTPVAQSLLAEFPDVKLDVMVGPNGKEIFEGHEKINDVIIYDKKSPFREKFMLFLILRKKKYGLVVDLRNTILPVVLGARHITNPIRHARKDIMHKKDVHLSRLKDIGLGASGGEFYIPVKSRDRERANRLLEGLEGRPYVVVSPGAKSHVKRWPLKNFARLSDMIKSELKHEVVLIGDRNDRVVIERILFYMKTTPLNLIEKTNIPELAHIIKKGKLLIANDSAPLHLGSAVDSRILTFFGPTNYKEYGPVTRREYRVLRKDIKCSPCTAPQCINTEKKYECLTSISVEEAFRAAKGLLTDACFADANR